MLLDEATSRRIGVESVRNGGFVLQAKKSELEKLAKMDRKARFMSGFAIPISPNFLGPTLVFIDATTKN